MPLYQHRFHGNCASGDIFAFSWWSDSANDLPTAQAGAVAWVGNLWAGPAAGAGYADQLTADVVVTRVTTGTIEMASGLQQALAEDVVSHPGVAVGDALPADVALVVSLRTALANRRGRGRFYLPQPAALTLTADGRYDTALQAELADALVFAFNGYSAVGDPVVYSRVNRTVQDITSLDVGDLFDTQRRRENSLVEVRATRTMP